MGIRVFHFGSLCGSLDVGTEGIVVCAELAQDHAGGFRLGFVGLALGGFHGAGQVLFIGILDIVLHGGNIGFFHGMAGFIVLGGGDFRAHMGLQHFIGHGIDFVLGDIGAEIVLIHIGHFVVVAVEIANGFCCGDFAAGIAGNNLAVLCIDLGDVFIGLHLCINFNQITAGKRERQHQHQRKCLGKSSFHVSLPFSFPVSGIVLRILYAFPRNKQVIFA